MSSPLDVIFGGSGLLAELVFGLTLANMPRTPRMVRQGERMLAFHSELTFLVRSFFFVLLGIMAKMVSKAYTIPIIAILVALVAARWLAVRATRWSIRDVNAADTELPWLMFPRGLITAVLALQVLQPRDRPSSSCPPWHSPWSCSPTSLWLSRLCGRSQFRWERLPGRRRTSIACGALFASEFGFRTRNDQLSRLSVGKTSRFYGGLDHLGSP